MSYSYAYNGGASSGYSRAPYSRNYSPSYQQPRVPQPPKKSGCRVIMKDKDTPIVTGWKTSKNGMLSLYARPYKGTKLSTSKNGKEWLNLFVTVTNRRTMQKTNMSGLFNLANQKLYIKEYNLIANPRANRGGYFGKHISKTYNR
ncbi:MAG: hypothetical protein QM751_06155 [Paludibacteraceae bacterium]